MQIGCRIRVRINIKIMWRLERNLYESNTELVRLNCNGRMIVTSNKKVAYMNTLPIEVSMLILFLFSGLFNRC